MGDSGSKTSGRLAAWGRTTAWLLLAVGVAALVRSWLLPPVPVEVVQPFRGLVLQEAFGTGTLEAKVVVGAGAKMVGKVVEVLADQGDTVAAGQCLARLESKDYEDAVRVAEAKETQAAAELAKAEADLERTRSLFSELIVSRAELDAQETARSVAQARLETARAERGFAGARLTDTRIVSPIQGLVVTRNLEVGSTVVPGAPIFRVADTKLLWVQAMVDEREAGRLVVGAPARVVLRSDPATPLPGRLSRLAREADRVTEELQADVGVDRLPAVFAFGQKADVWIETARKEHALLVPRSALVPRGSTPGVYVVEAGRARWRALKLGLQGRDAAEVLEGLREEDLVAREPLRGKPPLTEGRRVAATEGPRP
ncbi:MAG: efflux RND transporter periplasmic adaptor subunit [Vicinamibacteria bacterium]